MGCSQSHNVIQLKRSNAIHNLSFIQDVSDQDDNDKPLQEKKTFQNIDQKHRNIINMAIATAFKKFQNKQINKAQQEQKKIISSLNRYYQQNKKNSQYVDSENMSQTDYEFIIKILRRHHLFNELFTELKDQKDFLTKFLLSVRKKNFKFKDYIYKQHDPASKFYIVAEGKLYIELNSIGLATLLSRGDYIGLESIIYHSEQGESVKVKSSKAILYEIDKQQISKVREKVTLKNKEQIKQLFEQKVLFFNFLDNKQKQKILQQTVKSTYSKGQIIFQKDYEANAFFVIKKGYVLIKIPQKKDLILQEGNSFGQSSFYENKGQRKGKAIAYQDNTIIYAIGSKTIFKSLGKKLDCAVLHNLQKWALYRDPVINELFFTYNFNMEKFILLFEVKKGEKFQLLGRKGQLSQKVFINMRCQINFSRDLNVFCTKVIKQLLNEYFSLKKRPTRKLIDNVQQLNETNVSQGTITKQNKFLFYEQDVIITEKGVYSEAKVQKIFKFLVQTIQKSINTQKILQTQIKLSVKNVVKYAKIQQSYDNVTLLAVEKHFNIEHIIKVYPKKRDKKQKFNLQSLDSKPLVSINFENQNDQQQFLDNKDNRIKQILQQKSLIQSLNYPQICGFYKAEQDQDNIYLLYEYIKGVTLFEVQIELGIMPEMLVQYYVLKLALILDYLHRNFIVYRDLKLENVIVDNKGYPNFYDFKTAKRLTQKNSYKTSTLIGTPHYISPQMIQRKQYSFQVDYWQLGVMLYELIYDTMPFADTLDDPIQIFNQILQKQPKLKKQNSRNLLNRLLNKNPAKRISSFQQLVKQNYFQNFQWQELKQQRMLPPYIPKHPTQRFSDIEFYQMKQDDQ